MVISVMRFQWYRERREVNTSITRHCHWMIFMQHTLDAGLCGDIVCKFCRDPFMFVVEEAIFV